MTSGVTSQMSTITVAPVLSPVPPPSVSSSAVVPLAASSQSVVKMAKEIASYADLERLTHINGLSIVDDIEPRARPGRASMSGFIGAKERFQDVLKADWTAVMKEGMTHIEIAHHLEALIVAGSRDESLSNIKIHKEHLEAAHDNQSRRSFQESLETATEHAKELAEKMKKFNFTITHQGSSTKYRAEYLDWQLKEALQVQRRMAVSTRIAPLTEAAFLELQNSTDEQSLKAQRAHRHAMEACLKRNASGWECHKLIGEILTKEGVDPRSEDRKLREATLRRHCEANKETYSKLMSLKAQSIDAVKIYESLNENEKKEHALANELSQKLYQAKAAKLLQEIEQANKLGVEVIFVQRNDYGGCQTDLFGSNTQTRSGWSYEHILTNARTLESVLVSGGSVDYIERFGFYEGGEQEGNPYRIDPRKVIRILTGRLP